MDFLHYQTPIYDSHFPRHYNASQPSHNVYPNYIDLQLQTAQYNIQSQRAMNPLIIDTYPSTDKNETKPRLAKQEVELLERLFQENHKPPSALKRQLANQMGVDVARINNWFQNRRAKAKQESKQLDFDRLNNNSLSYSEPSSPDHFSASTGLDDNSLSSLPDPMLRFSMSTGLLPPPVPACSPQYEDSTAASLFEELPEQFMTTHFGGPLYHDPPASDRAQFSVASATCVSSFNFDGSSSFPAACSAAASDRGRFSRGV